MSFPRSVSNGISVCVPSGAMRTSFCLPAIRRAAQALPGRGLRQAACGFKGHTQVFPIRPCGHILRRKAAAGSPRRCGFDLFQLRGVFCLPAHGAEGQRFTFRSAESKLPAIGAASVRAALPQTIGALRAGSVRGPCTELVSQLIGRVCGVAVFAAGAGKNSIAVCFTGRLYGNSLIVVSQDGQLRVGGIVAAGAGVISVPALFRAGGGFCIVIHQSYGSVRTAPHRWYSRSGSRCRKRPSRVSYKWGLRIMMHQIMII